MHAVGPRHLWTPNGTWKRIQVCIAKNPYVSGPMTFKPILFKGQLYLIFKNFAMLLMIEL